MDRKTRKQRDSHNEFFYKGAETSRKDLKDAKRKCKENEKKNGQEKEGKEFDPKGKEEGHKESVRKQERTKSEKENRECARIWGKISEATKGAEKKVEKENLQYQDGI